MDLIGANGILPVENICRLRASNFGGDASVRSCRRFAGSTRATLSCIFCAAAGVVLSILLMCGIVPVVSLVLLFVFYLSLTIAGQTFLSFQWDILLLETGFLVDLSRAVALAAKARARRAVFSRRRFSCSSCFSSN